MNLAFETELLAEVRRDIYGATDYATAVINQRARDEGEQLRNELYGNAKEYVPTEERSKNRGGETRRGLLASRRKGEVPARGLSRPGRQAGQSQPGGVRNAVCEV
jgi:hypothetical protein